MPIRRRPKPTTQKRFNLIFCQEVLHYAVALFDLGKEMATYYPDNNEMTAWEFDRLQKRNEELERKLAESKKKIFLIGPVRGADDVLQSLLDVYVMKLESLGYKVHYPTRDTEQNDPSGGYEICKTNFKAILDADEVHIWYDESSNGSKFDMGGLFMLHVLGIRKKVVIVNKLTASTVTPGTKSFLKVMEHLAALTT